MYEHLASFGGGPPTGAHTGLYALWGFGGWGMVVTGNIQIDSGHLTLGRDLLLPRVLDEDSVRPFLGLARAIHGAHQKPPLAVMQISHSGRQCASFIGGRRLFDPPLAPSAVPLGRSSNRSWLETQLYKIMFITPKAMTLSDIDNVVAGFVRCGELAVQAGFDGVELHASHGCMYVESFPVKSNLL
jgi:2,4-dienoyl-CoA reductase-like NADH-dependent reductase (Old Yellow Enzyme family)